MNSTCSGSIFSSQCGFYMVLWLSKDFMIFALKSMFVNELFNKNHGNLRETNG